MKLITVFALGAGLAASAPLVSERQANACFLIGNDALPKEVSDVAVNIQDRITCDTSKTTISGVPDVSSGDVSFSSVNFAASSQTPLEFALDKFATPEPLRTADLATFQRQLDVYLATEAGIRSVGGNLGIKVPKFFLQFQVSRIQTAQGNPPAAAGQQVDHLLQKVLKNAPKESQQLKDQVTALAKVLA
ncbi:hypothetical protein C8A01DRAFT_51000 [Parachaetomium inaequale]|uniref:DUF7143 domain-containing protein n=1 Tax=Parachaetomium inaequale TaxID=2588326 RepID=A0AAN6P5I0_9PEZI|nr:hypothetical protein C8A01DRAFT_51000 [Parachaetomium inaequale]